MSGQGQPRALVTGFFTEIGEFVGFSLRLLARLPRRSALSREGIRQAHRLGVESLTVVNLCCFFIGLVLVLQTAAVLARYGARSEVSSMLAVAFVREIGPVFAAVMFAGRVGTGVSAELGSMVVSEQIDAYRSFGVDPLSQLGAPRVLACAGMLPALTLFGCLVGISSGYVVGIIEGTVTPRLFFNQVIESLAPLDIFACLTKAGVFGLLIGLVATFTGLRVPRASEAVGAASTATMVRCVIAILASDLILTKLFLIMEGP